MPTPPDEPAGRVRELVERIVATLGVSGRVEVQDDGETVRATVGGDDLGLLIGRHGQTIDAIQHLAVRVARTDDGPQRRVVVDASGYRDRREAALHEAADRAADESLRYGRPIALDAMNAFERRIVHEYLRERGGVDTYSEGEDPDRRLVVAPPA